MATDPTTDPTADPVTDRLASAVRHQLDLGRLLPLGPADDGTWITERAATSVLREAAESTGGSGLGRLRLSPVDPGAAPQETMGAVPAPPSALPHGPLRLAADVVTAWDQPLPAAADRLRSSLTMAADRLGLPVATVDLHVIDVRERPEPATERRSTGQSSMGQPARTAPGVAAEAETGSVPEGALGDEPFAAPPDRPAARLAEVAAAVTGVGALTPALAVSSSSGLRTGAYPARAVRLREGTTAPAGCHVEVQLAVAAGHRALDVAAAVREAVVAAQRPHAAGPVTVAVLITEVGPGSPDSS